jgi:Ser-tRNA(Ala) deacylase AlaX
MGSDTRTHRLYWDDAQMQSFKATVIHVGKKSPDGVPVVLDATAFYPEGGGQPPDEGRLGDAEVLDVQEEDGVIIHHTDRPLVEGEQVDGSIDWVRRWDHMQQHTGQHLLSRVVMEEFDAHTRGFHLSGDETTIDLTVELDGSQIQMAVSRANALIDQDIPVTARIVPADDPAVAAARRPWGLPWSSNSPSIRRTCGRLMAEWTSSRTAPACAAPSSWSNGRPSEFIQANERNRSSDLETNFDGRDPTLLSKWSTNLRSVRPAITSTTTWGICGSSRNPSSKRMIPPRELSASRSTIGWWQLSDDRWSMR